MADCVILLSLRPGKVIGDVKVNVSRPRVSRDPAVLDIADEILSKMGRVSNTKPP